MFLLLSFNFLAHEYEEQSKDPSNDFSKYVDPRSHYSMLSEYMHSQKEILVEETILNESKSSAKKQIWLKLLRNSIVHCENSILKLFLLGVHAHEFTLPLIP